MPLLKFVGAIDEVCLTIIHKNCLNLQLFFLCVKGPNNSERLDYFVLIVLFGDCKWISGQNRVFLARGRAIISYSLEKKMHKKCSDSSALESGSDQICQTEVACDQTFQAEVTSDQTFQTALTSDETWIRSWPRIFYAPTAVQTL